MELYEYVFDGDEVVVNTRDIHSDIIYNTSGKIKYTDLLDVLTVSFDDVYQL